MFGRLNKDGQAVVRPHRLTRSKCPLLVERPPLRLGYDQGMNTSALLVCALTAYSVHEHQEGFVREIKISLNRDGFAVEDDGRGIGLHRERYVDNLMGTLVGGPGPVQLHGVGLSVVAASLSHLTVQSRRSGQLWTQTFGWGIAEGVPTHEPVPDTKTGSLMVARLAPGMPVVAASELEPQLDVWRSRNPGLLIRVL
ncbi:MAG: hypothetical protein ACJ8GO_14615 [Ramlibacter sp.]